MEELAGKFRDNSRMNQFGSAAIGLFWGLASIVNVYAEDAALTNNPYSQIVTRNIFGLLPQPKQMPAAPLCEPPPKIELSGIMSIFGCRQVLLKISALPKHTGDNPEAKSYILSEGEQADLVKIMQIDEDSSLVTISNHGIVQEFSLVKSLQTHGALTFTQVARNHDVPPSTGDHDVH